jgi:uncharacterized protein with HEPN domain
MSRDESYLLDILLMARDARDFVKDMAKGAFLADRKTQYAVVRCLEVIGEAAKRLSEDAHLRYPDIPWSAMAGMRDLLIHSYDKVDVNEVWDTVQRDIPMLISALERVIPPEPGT